MKYIVIEIQSGDTLAVLNYEKDNINEAYHKFYEILMYASLSEVPIHTAMIITEKGDTVRVESFDHREEPNE